MIFAKTEYAGGQCHQAVGVCEAGEIARLIHLLLLVTTAGHFAVFACQQAALN